MSRGRRLHCFFREMVGELSRDFRVVVLATDDEIASFSTLPGVDVRRYESLDLAPDPTRLRRNIPDLRKTAAEIETRTGLPVYKAASNYILYGQFVRAHGGKWEYLRTDEEILEAYAGAYAQLSSLFVEIEPSVVFYETVDRISTYLALALAVKHGVFAFGFKFASLTQGLMNLLFGLHRKNVTLEHLYMHRDLIRPESYSLAEQFIRNYTRRPDASAYAAIHRRMTYGKSPFNGRRLLGAVTQVDQLGKYVKNLHWYGRIAANRAWLRRHLTTEIPHGKYIVYSLQHSPEASTYSQVPRWARQEVVVEQLAINAPSGVRIVVKEHPRTYGMRGREFFEPLLQIPNVVLCHPLTDNRSLLSGAEAIVALTGSVGLEGITLGKKVGVLGRPYYSCYAGVKLLDHPEDIYPALACESWNPGQMADEQRHFVAAYLQSCYEFGHGSGPNLWPSSGGEKWAHALRETMSFIETHKLKPYDFDAGL